VEGFGEPLHTVVFSGHTMPLNVILFFYVRYFIIPFLRIRSMALK
jgi:hypothetical protein